MNEVLIMIAQHLWTEHSPAAELQDVKKSHGGTDAGRQQSFYNTHRHTQIDSTRKLNSLYTTEM